MTMTDPGEIQRKLRELPGVDTLLARLERTEAAEVPRELVLAWIREELAEARRTIREADAARAASHPRDREAWESFLLARIETHLAQRTRGMLRRVVNATGVLIHTNLGRAPLAAAAQAALVETASGYSSLETDLNSGRRRSRLEPIRRLLPQVTGAEDGLAVHNNAAAVYLALTAIAAGKEVVVSRGHLVEIGGSFRLPEIMSASGAHLVEVGSTNRTRISDYAAATGPNTAMILHVHPSNFRLVGFAEETPIAELADLARKTGVAFLADLGSGALRQHGRYAFDEPRVQDALESGADLVSFSGDKLLGGPQAGLLVGRRSWIERMARHPVARVVRLDKTALAALEATLEAYLDPARLFSRLPLLHLLSLGEGELERTAEAWISVLRSVLTDPWAVSMAHTQSEVGGGSLPGLTLPSRAVVVGHPAWSPDQIARGFRLAVPPVIGRIEKGRFLLDVRAALGGEEELLRAAAATLEATLAGEL